MLAAQDLQQDAPSAQVEPADSDSDDEGEMIVDVPDILKAPSECTVCRICLLTEGKMEPVSDKYVAAYNDITGIKWDKADLLPQHICWECARRLITAARFKSRAISAHKLLLELRSDRSYITLNDIKLVDRSLYHLTSSLSVKRFRTNEYNSQKFVSVSKILEGMKKPFKLEQTDVKVKNDAVQKNIDNDTDIEKPLNDRVDVKIAEDSDDSDCLVIDDSGNDAMPIDELIDIYSKDEDGDGRLQELNEQFGGTSSMQIDQCWGGEKPAETVKEAEERLARPRRRRGPQLSDLHIPRLENISRAYDKLDRSLFTITRISVEEQIAEILKRQDCASFKRANFKCQLCYRTFVCRKALDAHMAKHDPAIGEYECVICHARQKNARALKTHMYGQHTVRVACKRCAFVTMNRCVARTHQRWHAGTIYRCSYCPSEFSQESRYQHHLRSAHAHAHACPLCGRTFVSAKGLAVHRVKRHPTHQVPLVGPTCTVCDVRFASDEAYDKHLKLSSRHQTDNTSLIELRKAGN